MSRLGIGVFIAMMFSLGSCSKKIEHPPTFPVTGRVIYEGKAAGYAVVILHPLGSASTADRPRGKADVNGEFSLGTYSSSDGAPAGEYAVTVEWKRVDDHPEQGIELLPASYGDPKTTKLRTTIIAGSNEPLILKLSRNP